MRSRNYIMFLLLAFGIYGIQPVLATDFTVNTTIDEIDTTPGDGLCATASGQCSLRAAIMETNELSGDEQIFLPAGTYTLTIPGLDDSAGADGDLDIRSHSTDKITISGDGMDSTIIDGNGAVTGEGVFEITTSSSVTVTFENLKITGGVNAGVLSNSGANLVEFKSVDISGNSIVTSNSKYAGGISLRDTDISIYDSIISNNTATAASKEGVGGVYVGGMGGSRGYHIISGTTISENSVIGGTSGSHVGGLRFWTAARIINSTISGNIVSTSSTRDGVGGVLLSGDPEGQYYLLNTTITNNSVTRTGGSGETTGGLGLGGVIDALGYIKNSIIAGNTTSGDTNGVSDCLLKMAPESSTFSKGYNLIGDVKGCNFVAATGDLTGDSSGSGVLSADLDTLQDNGGTTKTHKLQSTSPAIDAGDPAGCLDVDSILLETDQRGSGYSRTVGGVCDIGAYEVQESVCGNGMLESAEACDDGNTDDADGCSSACTIEETNHVPVADAGPDRPFAMRTDKLILAKLEGIRSSDPDGDPLTFAWTLVSAPATSAMTTASIYNANKAIATVLPDVLGEYEFMLTVTDPEGLSDTDTVKIVRTK